MGLSERKDKQRIGYDPRNLSWSGDKDRFSYKHMTALGWTDTSGIGGAALTGNAKHIAVVQKLDASGIGMARAMKEGDAMGGQARAGLEDVLKRLASASASASPSPSPAPSVEEPKRNRIASRQRHLHSKRLASSSPAALAEILGIPVDVKPDIKPDIKPTPAELEAKPQREAEDMVSTSTLSVSEYFRQKMRDRAVARQTALGEPVEPELPIASSSKLSSWEGTKMAFAETETPLSFSDSPVVEPATGSGPQSKEEKRAAKKARKAEKEARRAARSGKQEDGDVGAVKRKRKREVE